MAQECTNSTPQRPYLGSLRWRCIGPFRGGRVLAIAGHPTKYPVFYFGAHTGGVWKTTDAGMHWQNISDGFFNTACVSCISISQSDPNVIYVGTGEAGFQSSKNDESHGDGVYKTTDGGNTWMHLGLEDTRHISKIRVHPSDPNTVYVAALGHVWGHNETRGVYRSQDGGTSWERVLYISEKAGAADLIIDPHNPRILYATIWEAIRKPWTHSSGGPDSGIYMSRDGGSTWVDLSDNPGMPKGVKGKIGVAVSPAKSGRIWALIQSEEGGLYRSDDGGLHWEKLTGQYDLWVRAREYMLIYADPQDSETCYVLSAEFWQSIDGGYTFQSVPLRHGDHRDLWIDPCNPLRMAEASDGGAMITLNGGDTWSTHYNQPTASLYYVTTDNQFPYRVYSAQYDNSAISVPSRANEFIQWKDCYPVGSAEAGHVAVRIDDPDIIYTSAIGSSPGGGGNLLRYNRRTEQTRIITVWPEEQQGAVKDVKYRFGFHFPVVISPHDTQTLYAVANIAFRSRDEGTTWEPFSPDLTLNDVSKMQEIAGGPISKESATAGFGSAVSRFVESIHKKGVFWTGSDDGLIHLSQDNGKTWENVTPNAIEEWTLISSIEISPHDEATVYVAATRYKLDDNRPYLYKTNDYGKTWKKITNGIPDNDFTRVVREDPTRPGLLYAGTETGVYISFDDGANWETFQLNLPIVPIYDLAIKDNDLIAATHGRSFWILDDVTLLHQLEDKITDSDIHLFKPRATYRILSLFNNDTTDFTGTKYQRVSGSFETSTFNEFHNPGDQKVRKYLDVGENPPDGVIIHYFLRHLPEGKICLSILDHRDEIIKTFTNDPITASDIHLSIHAGMNRFIWDMRYRGASGKPTIPGPIAPPGFYKIRIATETYSQTETFELLKDPRAEASQEDLVAQFDFLLQIRNRLTQTNKAVHQMRRIRKQILDWRQRSLGSEREQQFHELADGITEKLDAIEYELVVAPGIPPQRPPPSRLSRKLVSLASVVASADWIPTTQSYEVFIEVSSRIEQYLQKLAIITDNDINSLSRLISDIGLPNISTEF